MNRKVAGSRPICSHSSSTQPHLLDELLGGGVREEPVGEARGAADRGLGAPADETGMRRRRRGRTPSVGRS